jgi:hypothetical protein
MKSEICRALAVPNEICRSIDTTSRLGKCAAYSQQVLCHYIGNLKICRALAVPKDILQVALHPKSGTISALL